VLVNIFRSIFAILININDPLFLQSCSRIQRVANVPVKGIIAMSIEKISFYKLPEQKLNDKVSRWVATGKNMSVTKYSLKKGSSAPMHHHSVEQATMVLQGRLFLIAEGKEMILESGDLLFIPPNTPHGGGEALEDVVSLDFFSPPREDIQDGTDPLKKCSKEKG